MSQVQIIEGTTEEIALQLTQTFAGQKLRVFVEPKDHEDLIKNLPDPPNTVLSREQLIELLREGMEGEPLPVTDQDWAEIRQEVRNRITHPAS